MAYTPNPTIQGIPSDDGNLEAVPTRALPQRVARIGFTKNVTGGVDPEWGALVGSVGGGMAVNQTGSNLVITSGTTARSETIIRSTQEWEGGIRMRVRSTLSQRIANNNFFAELVDVIGDGLTYSIGSATAITVTIPSNPFTSNNVGQSMYIGGFSGTGTFLSGRYPIASVSGNDVTFTVAAFAVGTGTCSLFGWNYYQLLYTGTTATNASFDAQRKGYASGATTATINTTASPGHLAIVTGNDLSAALADQLIASTAGTIQQSVRATRVENVPDDASLRMQIRVANGSTAPASTTTWTIGFVSLSNYANQDVTVQDVRPMGVASAMPVEVLRSSTIATTLSSGTVTTLTTLSNGQTAHSTASTGSPLRIAGRVKTTNDTTLVAGDASDIACTTDQAAVIKPFAVPELDWQFACAAAVANTTDVVLKTAASAGLRNYITGFQIINSSATIATEVVIKDGSTVIWRGYVGVGTVLNAAVGVSLLTPLKGTAATALNFACITTASAVYVNCQGYVAP